MESVIFRAQIFSLPIIPSRGDLKWGRIVPPAPSPTAHHFFFATDGFGSERCRHLRAIVLLPLDKAFPALPFSPRSRTDTRKLWNYIPGVPQKRFKASPETIRFGFNSLPARSPLLFVRPGGTEDGFVGLNRGDCFTSSAHSASPLPCCKTPAPARGTVGALCGRTIPPRFYLGPRRSRVLFPLKRKHLLGGGEGVFLLLPLTRRLKERLMGESSPRKPG